MPSAGHINRWDRLPDPPRSSTNMITPYPHAYLWTSFLLVVRTGVRTSTWTLLPCFNYTEIILRKNSTSRRSGRTAPSKRCMRRYYGALYRANGGPTIILGRPWHNVQLCHLLFAICHAWARRRFATPEVRSMAGMTQRRVKKKKRKRREK